MKYGDKNGKYWMPAMSDAPLRGFNGRHEWFWEANDEAHIFPLKNLTQMYYNSVGHNSTLILGLTPDNRGLIPDADAQRLKEWADDIKSRFSNPIKTTQGEGTVLALKFDKKQALNNVILQEDIAFGERVRVYKIEAEINDTWQIIAEGECIGHKHIQKFETIMTSKLRLTISESNAVPLIKNFSAFYIN